MKTCKRIISAVMCMILLIGPVAVGGNGFAQLFDAFSVSASAGGQEFIPDELTWDLSGSGTLTIGGYGDMTDSYGQGYNPPWYENRSSIKSIVVNEGVTSIGDDAFENCYNATNVSLPSSLKAVDYGAFKDCTKLSNINIKNNITSIGMYAFSNTAYSNNSSNWTNSVLYLGNYLLDAKDTIQGRYSVRSNTKVIGGCAFDNCTKLTGVVLPSSLITIGYAAFDECTALTDISIPSSVTSIEDAAFAGCSSLRSISIPSSVTYIGFMLFNECTNLSSITLPDSITEIEEYAFDDTAYYNNASNWINNVLYIGKYLIKARESISGTCYVRDNTKVIAAGAFNDCNSLNKVVLPDGLTHIGREAFWSCDVLSEITIPKSVKSIGDNAFDLCHLKTVYYLGSVVEWCSIEHSGSIVKYDTEKIYVNGRLYSELNTSDLQGISVIPDNAFYAWNNLVKATVPGTVKTVDVQAFAKCRMLKEVTFNEGVESIEYGVFWGCNSLEKVVIPNSVTYIDKTAFWDCPDSMVIYGYTGSYAQSFAAENNIRFRTLNQSGVPEISIINNPAGREVTVGFATDVTLRAELTGGNADTEICWFIYDGTGETLKDTQMGNVCSVYCSTDLIILAAPVYLENGEYNAFTDADGKMIFDYEKITVRNGFFARFIAILLAFLGIIRSYEQ